MPRYDAYVRVSRVAGREGASFISPAVQREAIYGWAKLRGVEIVQTHVDLDQSGGKLQRPGLDALMARIRAKEIDGLAVARLDRLSRAGVGSALRLVEEIHAAGAGLAVVDLGIDPTTAFGEFGMTLMLAIGRMEHRRFSESWQNAKLRATDRGAKIGPTPFGYERQDDGTLLPGKDGALVTEAFQVAAGRGLHDAATLLTQKSGRMWTTSAARRIFANRTYLGESSLGDHVKADTHPALTTRAVWEAAQHGALSRRAAEAFPLSKLAVCGTCGAPMVAGRAGKGVRTYRCSHTLTQYAGERCPRGAHILAASLEEFVREQVRDAIGRPDLVVGETDSLALAATENTLDLAEMELDAFASDLTLRRALGARYHEHAQARVAAVERAREAYRAQAKRSLAPMALPLPTMLDGPPGEFGELLRSMLVSVVVQPGRGRVAERVTVVPFDADTPSRIPPTGDA